MEGACILAPLLLTPDSPTHQSCSVAILNFKANHYLEKASFIVSAYKKQWVVRRYSLSPNYSLSWLITRRVHHGNRAITHTARTKNFRIAKLFTIDIALVNSFLAAECASHRHFLGDEPGKPKQPYHAAHLRSQAQIRP